MALKKKLRKQLIKEDFWNLPCVHSGEYGVEAEHAFEYARNQIQERWAIVPVARRFNHNPTGEIKEKSQLYALNQCKKMGEWENTKAKYPKKDWEALYKILLQKHNIT